MIWLSVNRDCLWYESPDCGSPTSNHCSFTGVDDPVSCALCRLLQRSALLRRCRALEADGPRRGGAIHGALSRLRYYEISVFFMASNLLNII